MLKVSPYLFIMLLFRFAENIIRYYYAKKIVVFLCHLSNIFMMYLRDCSKKGYKMQNIDKITRNVLLFTISSRKIT